ncbi:hypothetical protein PS3A_32310 [Pseudomonas sp. 3A(2025)]
MWSLSTFIPPASARKGYVSEEARLKQQALRFMQDYPDAYTMAWAAARKLLYELTGKSLNPDTVWWHRFSTSMSSPRTFTGWQHAGTPVESMTLVELMMRRFNAHDQEDTDDLQLYGGFYTDGPQHGTFDERNEVAVLPRTVLEKFWALNFSSLFQQRVDAFWRVHAETFCELARARFLALAGLAARDGDLSQADLHRLVRVAIPDTRSQNDNELYPEAHTGLHAISVRSFDVAGIESGQIMRLVEANGRQTLYVPGMTPAFHVCESERELYGWVRRQLADEASRKGFEALFLRSPQAREEHGVALAAALDRIRDQAFGADRNHIDTATLPLFNQKDQVIVGDVFEHLRSLARQEMQALAHELASNASLRKQMWIGYFNAFLRIFGPTAMFTWPLALVMVGAGIANVGLNIDQAVNASGSRQRKAGVIGAILNSIFVLFNLPLLADAVPALRATLWAVPDSPGLAGAGPDAESQEWIALQQLDHGPLTTGEGLMQGVERSTNGDTWIMLGESPRRVRYSSALKSWLVVDPLNPFAFDGSTAVRLNAEGQWELQPVLRLSGGSPMQAAVASEANVAPYPTVQSSFWDTYMRLNFTEEERLSDLALARQKAVINVHEVSDTDEVELEDLLVLDASGNQYRVFKTPQGRYVGGRVNHYTEHEEDFNGFLRTGFARVANQAHIIEELADDLSVIGYNNQVTLYRGGSSARGTSGLTFRSGQIKAGDVLVNTDFTSFSENPYVTRSFASSQAGAPSYGFDRAIRFDDTSIVFELPAGEYLNATPIAPFSQEDEEAESLFIPGHYFKVQNIQEVVGNHYKFIKVQLREVPVSQAGSQFYEMRTGQLFTRAGYAARLGVVGQRLVERFFPVPVVN